MPVQVFFNGMASDECCTFDERQVYMRRLYELLHVFDIPVVRQGGRPRAALSRRGTTR